MCQKYASQRSLCNHTKNFHTKTQIIRICQDNIKEISGQNPVQQTQKVQNEKTYECRYCDKINNHKQNRWAHKKTCKAKVAQETHKKQQEEIENMQLQVKVLKLMNENNLLKNKLQKEEEEL